MNEKKTFLCRNYYNGEWHEHMVIETDAEIKKSLPICDRKPIMDLSVGETLTTYNENRIIKRIA